MSLHKLTQKIKLREARLAVIGLGYVGLPVACEFANAGFDVLGIELRRERVEKINAGISPIEGNEPGLDDLLRSVVQAEKLHASTNYSGLTDRDIILIDVETPVDGTNVPRYEALRSVLKSLAPVMKPGALVIVESTIAPGTIREVVLPLLSEDGKHKLNKDFYLGNCPERVMPGKLLANLRNVSRVVGGMSQETAQTMIALYRHVVKADLDGTDCVTAELVKTTENAYRDVQIAFANEVALICEAVGADVWKVRDLVNKSPGRQMHLPGAGVGGHCIPKDPWLLAYGAKDKGVPLHLIPAAREINDRMPIHMAELVEETLKSVGCDLEKSRILVMGYAYLENSDDTRNSPSEALVRRLRDIGAEVVIHDPYVKEYQGNVLQMSQGCDAVVVMVKHKNYQDLDLDILRGTLRTPLLIDGRRLFTPEQAYTSKLIYRGIGIGGNV